ncbi:MAG: hypothetical protein R3Y13_05315 [bacterium]
MNNNISKNTELINSGMVDAIKSTFDYNSNIPEKYYILMADYIDSLTQIENSLFQDPIEVARLLSSSVSSVDEIDMNGIYGKTVGSKITMNLNLDYDSLKLYFFHELTHTLQTRVISGKESCGFYNGHDGMFLTEGSTQYIAELLQCASNNANNESRVYHNAIRGLNHHQIESSLSEYQFNGNIIVMIAHVTALPVNQIVSLSYREDGREMLQDMYDLVCGVGSFDTLMFDLEQIYMIDKLIINGNYSNLNVPEPIDIVSSDGLISFKGNINSYNLLINKVQRDLMSNFMLNNNTEYVLSNYQYVEKQLTTPELKEQFLNAIHELSNEYTNNISHSRNNGFVNVKIMLTVIAIIIFVIIISSYLTK